MTELNTHEIEQARVDHKRRIRNRVLIVIGMYFLIRLFRSESSLFYMGGGSEMSSSLADLMIGLCYYLLLQA